jgi:tRNA(Ile)-lysidine synthetase-like protein
MVAAAAGIPAGKGPSRENSLSAHVLPADGEAELLIRSFRDGDRWRPDSRKKVKESWNLFKVPRLLRSQIPLVFSGSRLLWIPGLPPPHHAVAAETKGVRLELRCDPESALGCWLANAAGRLNCGAPSPLI